MILRDSIGNAVGHTEVTEIPTKHRDVIETVFIPSTRRDDSALDFAAELWATAIN